MTTQTATPTRLRFDGHPVAHRATLLPTPLQPTVPEPLARAVRTPPAPSPSLRLSSNEQQLITAHFNGLTPKERAVLFAICLGGTNEQIAAGLRIALPTLRTHLMRLNQKLATQNKADVVRLVASRLLDAYRAGDMPPR